MALSLIALMTDKWHPDKYADEYRAALLKLIHEKIEHPGKLPAPPPAKRPTNVIDLVSVLQESLARAHEGHPKRKAKTRGAPKQRRKLKKAA